MNRDQIEELAALDALGALDGEDAAAWERVCRDDPAAALLRDELATVTAQLARANEPAAPEALRARVMDAVFGADPQADPATTAIHPFGWRAWTAAAAIALLALAGTAGITAQQETVVVRDSRPDARSLHIPLSGYGEYADAKANVLWDSGQRGWYVQAAGLPDLPPTHRYRVWAIGEAGELHDCGELPRRPDGLARRFVIPGEAIESMQGFAVTVEPAGTNPEAPSTPAVLISPALRG